MIKLKHIMSKDIELYHELAFYTLSHGDSGRFIHQHIVDAYAAQHASENLKPITTLFAVVGLYLFVERNFSGRQVQQAHMKLAKNRKFWPSLPSPAKSATLTVADVLRAKPGEARDCMIENWSKAVWDIWKEKRPEIETILKENGII